MVTTKLVGGQTGLGWNGWPLYLVEVHQRALAPIPGLDRLWRRLEQVETIPHVRSTGTVAVVGDTMVIGVGGNSVTAWQHDVRTRELFRRPQPLWLNASWPTPPPGLSTDGQFIAYLAQDHDTTRLTVRTWPEGRIVALSPAIKFRQMNRERGGAIFWANPKELQVRLPVLDSGPSIAWLAGKVRGGGVDVVTWKIYPDYTDPDVIRPTAPPVAPVAVVDTAAASPHAVQDDRWERAAREIERLPPAAFPELPRAFAAQLEQLGCTIPQSGYTGQRGNVIRGSFGARGQQD